MIRRWLTVGVVAASLAVPAAVPGAARGEVADQATPQPRAPTPEALVAWLDEQRDALRLPGLSVVVLLGGRTLAEVARGEAAPGVPVTLDTPFRLGSTTKQLTGLVVQRLVADGRLGLDQAAVSVLPELAGGDPRWSGITVRHLLTHRSGLREHATLAEQTLWPATRTLYDEALRIARDEPLTDDPGTRFVYDDAGYTVLGAIVERVTNGSYEEALQDLVARPLGLGTTTSDLARARADGLARDEYTWFGLANAPTPGPTWPVAAPGAGATSTARDLTTLLRAHLDGSDPVLAAAREPLADGDGTFAYASGWIVRPLWELTDGNAGWQDPSLPTLWEHSGQTTRSLSYLAFSPDLGLGVVALTNTGTGADAGRWDAFTDALVHEVLGTQPGPRVSGAVTHTPPLAVLAVALALLGATAWLARARRHRWLPAVTGGAGAVLAVLVAVSEDFSHTSWWGFYPDLAASVALGLVAAVAYAAALVGPAVRHRRGQPG